MAIAYSYLRFSKPDQEDGDSIRRQDALRDAWLKQHPDVQLVEEMRDKGSSAFKGHHREEGHPLAEFESLVEGGRVPKGAYFLIEALDRLSRQNPWVSVELLCKIVNAGIVVVTLDRNSMEFRHGNDLSPLILAVVEFSKSNSESEAKSERLAAVWAQKKKDARESGKPLGRKHPAWIELVDGKYCLKPDAVRAVRLIFKWCAEGMGKQAIKQRLEAEGVPPISYGKEWHTTSISNILKGREALGEYQPMDRTGKKRVPDGDPIPGYYPAAVTEGVWHAAQVAMEGRKGRTGRRGETPNPFEGLLHCALDNCSMHVVTKKKRDGTVEKYIVSRFAAEHRPGSHFRSFPLAEFTDAVLGELKELEASDLFKEPGSSEVADLRGQLLAAERRLKVADEQWEKNPESKHWQRKVTQYDEEVRSIAAALEKAKQEASTPKSQKWAETVALMRKDKPGRLNAGLRATIEEIRVLIVPKGLNRVLYCQVFFKDTTEVRSYGMTYYPRDGRKVEMRTHLLSEWKNLPDLRDPAAVAAYERAILNS